MNHPAGQLIWLWNRPRVPIVGSSRALSDLAATVSDMGVDRRGQGAPALRAHAASFDSADYELRWPSSLVARELAALRVGADVRERHRQIEFLLEEAFLGEVPAHDFAAAAARTQTVNDPWGVANPTAGDGEDADGYLDRLLAYLPHLHEYQEPTPYWPIRHGRSRAGSPKTIEVQFAEMINELYLHGYFGRTVLPPCVDNYGYEELAGSEVLAERLGLPDLWPLRPDTWDEDIFFGLIEVFHDLAVRPRSRSMHDHDGCGWHYAAFCTDTGRALYRLRVNRLLASAGLALRLAESGEDVGRLVRTVDEGRTDLLDRALRTPDPGVAARVVHAVAQFRGRTATEHDKRSALLTLAGVLEERRELIRDKVGKKDEGALFTIANEFAIRHQRRGQQSNYDPIFLDWMFWWYLGTVELTDRLLARPDTSRSV